MPTLAQSILAGCSGAREARNAAMTAGTNYTMFNGMEIYTFWQDNSALIFIGGNLAVFAGKGQ